MVEENPAILNQFGDFANNEELSDVVVIVSEAKFYAHKMILAMCSVYFRTQFYSKHWSMDKQFCNPVVSYNGKTL